MYRCTVVYLSVPVLYLYYSKVVVYLSLLYRLSQLGDWSWGLPLPPFIRFDRFFLHVPYPSPLPLPGLGWASNPNPCYPPPIPQADKVGHDPRVCVHPTVLPP